MPPAERKEQAPGKEPKRAPDETQQREATLTDCLAPAQGTDELGRLGKYRVLGILGHGGMGVVFKGHDPIADRLVAIKAIRPSLGAGEAVRKRFLREARTMAAVSHERIVQLYEVNEDRGVPFLAMEYLVGEPLDQRIENGPPLSVAETLRIGREVAEGLAAAHARGLIHRDIKPANIWLESPRGNVKILDFGLARAVEEDTRITKSGAVLGTPSYMAPEQARGEKVDSRCDLFSLGVLLYRMSTNIEPFAAKDPLSTLMAIATVTPPAPQMRNFDVPVDLSDLILKLLEKSPAQRHATAQEVVDLLGRIERGETIAPASRAADNPFGEDLSDGPPTQRRTAKGSAFPIGLAIGGVVGIVAFVGAVVAYMALR